VTLWDFRGTKWQTWPGCKSSKKKSGTLMELEERHVIKFFHIKGRLGPDKSDAYDNGAESHPRGVLKHPRSDLH
jgi:hypothetical protein